jgi:arsenate reductase
MKITGRGRVYNVMFLCTGNSARSKSWDELAAPGGAEFDFVITVCDKAAGEVCPIWPGQPMTAHWGVDDPAAVTGSNVEKMLAFRDAFRALEHRIRIFVSLPFASLDRLRLQRKLDEIGGQQPAASDASTGT